MSSTELFDIVDDQNHLTGQVVDRKTAHTRGLRHRVAHVYVFRDRNGVREVLVHKRSKFKDHSPNTWDPRFGGHIAHGHEPLETAVREMKEEVGMTVMEDALVAGPVVRWDEPTNNEYQYPFAYRVDDLHERVLTFDDGEVQAVKWMDIDDVVMAVGTDPNGWTCRGQFGDEIRAVRDWINGL